MNDTVVKWGKYRGKPLDMLLMDHKYISWCKTQPGMMERFPELSGITMNQINITSNDSLASCTPEHNQLQNKFLEDDFVRSFLKSQFGLEDSSHIHEFLHDLYADEKYREYFGEQHFSFKDTLPKVRFETKHNWDVEIDDHNGVTGYITSTGVREEEDSNLRSACNRLRLFQGKQYLRGELDKYNESPCSLPAGKTQPKISKICFWFNDSIHYNPRVFIEIKPSLGDDYPHVLRKMTGQIESTTRSGHHSHSGPSVFVLYIGHFSSKVTTVAQLQKIFNLSGISVVFENKPSE